MQSALDQAAELLDRARSAGTPVIYIRHDGGAGSPYDAHDDIGQIYGDFSEAHARLENGSLRADPCTVGPTVLRPCVVRTRSAGRLQ